MQEGDEIRFFSGGSFNSLSSEKARKAATELKLHPTLKLSLSQSQVNRISFYNTILQINREIAGGTDEISMNKNYYAFDEEEWFLDAIKISKKKKGEDSETSKAYKFYSQKTNVLWKPSGSWWEARSKKNPKLGLKNHNKRWSYLWPMIYYHKFVARYLKRYTLTLRNQALLSFVNDELCAVSDQITIASLFTAADWNKTLPSFHTWVDARDKEYLFRGMSKLNSRSVARDNSNENKNNTQHHLLRHSVDKCTSKSIFTAQGSQIEVITKANVTYNENMKDKALCGSIMPQGSYSSSSHIYAFCA